MTATPTPHRHKAPENAMTVDLSTCPTPMRTRDGRRADFVGCDCNNRFSYMVSDHPHIYTAEGKYVSTASPADLIGPWWEVGRTYLHDGSAECPLPEGARGYVWWGDLNGSYAPPDLKWENVAAYTLTHLPEPKKSVAERLRDIADGPVKDYHLELLAIADELESSQ